jgi:hypothetical protein
MGDVFLPFLKESEPREHWKVAVWPFFEDPHFVTTDLLLFEPASRLGSPCLPLFLCPQAWSLSSGHKCDHSPPITMRELKTKTAQHTPNDWPPKVFPPYLALFTLSRLLTTPLVGRRWCRDQHSLCTVMHKTCWPAGPDSSTKNQDKR